MHPIIMIASDKDPAIGKAVEDLEAAGFEVRVLNSATAKLVDFLGAIAGVDDEVDAELPPEPEAEPELPPEAEPEPEVEPELSPEAEPKAKKKAKDEDEEDEDDPLDPKKMEAMIAGEPVQVQLVEGADIVLHPSKIEFGKRTAYALVENQFVFWPKNSADEQITGHIELALEGEETAHLTKVIFSDEPMNPPVLKIGRDWLKARTADPQETEVPTEQ
jgi:hypothetical protein